MSVAVGEGLYSKVQCIIGKDHMGIPTCGQKDGQTGIKTLLSRNFIKGMEIDLAIIKETAKQTTKKGHVSVISWSF